MFPMFLFRSLARPAKPDAASPAGLAAGNARRNTSAARFSRACALALLVLPGAPPALADETPERERLATLIRQLDLIDRLAVQAAQAASRGPVRYHFDYARLREDVERVRSGVRDYLAPPRAQPRDALPLSADYRIPFQREASP